jgi:hypothetical protein
MGLMTNKRNGPHMRNCGTVDLLFDPNMAQPLYMSTFDSNILLAILGCGSMVLLLFQGQTFQTNLIYIYIIFFFSFYVPVGWPVGAKLDLNKNGALFC